MFSFLSRVFRKPKPVPAPLKWRVFALEHPTEAKPVSTPAMSGDDLQYRASLINVRVNRSIKPRSDKGDQWTLWPKFGDCDDYAVTKRHELREIGIPSRLAVCRIQSGEAHMVLLVRVGKTDLVLDNLRNSLLTKRQTGYKFLHEQTDDPNVWVTG